MALELSQEALLDFLCQAGGRVTNAALLSHFKSFLRDPDAPPSEHQHRRELFKRFVNSVAAVRQDPDGTKCVVLKRRYRDLLGEEGLQRPRDQLADTAPAGGAAPCAPRGARGRHQQPGRRRGQERGEEPPGAGARVSDAGCNGLPATSAQEAGPGGGRRRVVSGQRAPGSPAADAAAAAGNQARCAAAGTQGRCCWECQQNRLQGIPGEQHLDAFRGPATAVGKEEAPAPPARGERGAPEPRLEGEPPPAEPAPDPAAAFSPPTTVEAADSASSPPAPPSRLSPPEEQWEPWALSALLSSTLREQQQRRTLEWVARHPQVPEARDQGPTRAWSILPDNFLQLPLSGASTASHSLFPVVPEVSSESGPRDPPMSVFRSIRCQLSLQDLDDFVDQESHDSEESSSGPKESPGGSEDGLQVAQSSPLRERLGNPAEDIFASPKEGSPGRSPQSRRSRGSDHNAQQVPEETNDLAGHPQEHLPWPASKLRRSFRRRSRADRAKLSSSDEEALDEDLLKRSRGPPRSRRTSRAGAMPSPRTDAAFLSKPAEGKGVVTEQDRASNSWAPSRMGPAALGVHRPEHKSSLVPLDAREHEWIVKLAGGSWTCVLTLFREDPHLALYRDFLTGYTALHWMAKHGAFRVLQQLVSGAQKAGITLDVNVRSSCGYTPLHLAAIHGHQGVIRVLVQRLSSRVNVRDNSGKKPWQYLTSNTSGEIWQLLGTPRGKPIFPVHPLVRSSSPTRKFKSREVSRHVTRKTSLAALLKSQHSKWKSANQYEKFWEREGHSD
ncbi:PREDICTED: ankyrin repeat domain-containing protein SOWAHB [Elephantulus edwardii]|uniref:ankyrin repeat domain-containing protein SOWAHB n=1 Tax=Elephantulus edwardii TaxID=28737 RepID=UPI0003F071E4|nr:PREDICTED: ankyrin repeat domain-containing protein SOWAHB [Elephantulus edwardii]